MKTLLEVSAIEKGTVIDHIPAKSLFKVMNILNLEHIDNQITFGTNLESKRIGTKAIIKVSDLYLSANDLNRIAIVAPTARVSLIDRSEVIEKHVVEVPAVFEGSIRCVNPMCVTNHEKITTRFNVLKNGNSVSLRCHYCEKITTEDQIEFVK